MLFNDVMLVYIVVLCIGNHNNSCNIFKLQ